MEIVKRSLVYQGSLSGLEYYTIVVQGVTIGGNREKSIWDLSVLSLTTVCESIIISK